jgi:hypothetical protein
MVFYNAYVKGSKEVGHMSIADYVIIIIISLGVMVAILSIYKQKKSGKCCGCGGGCTSCSRRCDSAIMK